MDKTDENINLKNNSSELIDMISSRSINYKSLPFWSWNDRLDKEELIHQIQEMKAADIGGFFMHARGGLETEYLGEDWLSLTGNCIDEAKKNGMQAWCYDEEGWPSGFAGGKVPSKGYGFQQKSLVFTTDENIQENTHFLGFYQINESGKITRHDKRTTDSTGIYITANKYYVDVLNRECIGDFIKETHEKYYERLKADFGITMSGFFTDEPQFSNGEIPWTEKIPSLFYAKYGYDIVDNLIALRLKTNNYAKVRNDFWCLINDLFINHYIKQIADWCHEKNCMLTGHLMAEDSLTSQMRCTAGVMSGYEYFDIPGMDWLGRNISNPVIPKQVSSVCEQLGKTIALTETYALCGWDVSFEELKWIAEWQYANGINILCQHLEAYSLRGARKRDYPPSLFVQQPWWKEYGSFIQYFSRLGSALSLGTPEVNVLLLHPIRSAYVAYNGNLSCEETDRIGNIFTNITSRLSELHIDHHYGDETILSKYGSIRGNRLKVGQCEYSILFLPELINISKFTANLIASFIYAGGIVFHSGALPDYIDGDENHCIRDLSSKFLLVDIDSNFAKSIICPDSINILENDKECSEILVRTQVIEEDQKLYFFCNKSKDSEYDCNIVIPGDRYFALLDLEKMEYNPIFTENCADGKAFKLHFMPMQSYVVVGSEHLISALKCTEEKANILVLDDTFEIDEISENTLTLDMCSYRIDEGDWQLSKAVILIQKELLERKTDCEIELNFSFKIENFSQLDKLDIAMECPEKYRIYINEEFLEYTDCGYFRDKSFRRIHIGRYIHHGNNKISLKCLFYQKEKVYDTLFNKNIHETERNKLTLDTELESIYIIGNFAVKNSNGFSFGGRHTIWADNEFVLADMPSKFSKNDLTTQGLCFFSGCAKLVQNLKLKKKAEERYLLDIGPIYAPVYKIIINGFVVKTVMWPSGPLNITGFIRDGLNRFELFLYSSNRNLLGPHHFAEGESYSVGPSTFTDTAGWADNITTEMWSDRYCFVRFGF